MYLEFPYQIVTFIGKEPTQGEPVYNGSNGWYPQVAIKRRFKITGIQEDQFIEELRSFFTHYQLPHIETGALVKPERMPVRVIHIVNQSDLKTLHSDILLAFSDSIASRYPEREGDNYYPHITAEYDGTFVLPVEEYERKAFPISNIWLLKDLADANSVAYIKIV